MTEPFDERIKTLAGERSVIKACGEFRSLATPLLRSFPDAEADAKWQALFRTLEAVASMDVPVPRPDGSALTAPMREVIEWPAAMSETEVRERLRQWAHEHRLVPTEAFEGPMTVASSVVARLTTRTLEEERRGLGWRAARSWPQAGHIIVQSVGVPTLHVVEAPSSFSDARSFTLVEATSVSEASCGRCRGSGQVVCLRCNGQGWIRDDQGSRRCWCVGGRRSCDSCAGSGTEIRYLGVDVQWRERSHSSTVGKPPDVRDGDLRWDTLLTTRVPTDVSGLPPNVGSAFAEMWQLTRQADVVLGEVVLETASVAVVSYSAAGKQQTAVVGRKIRARSVRHLPKRVVGVIAAATAAAILLAALATGWIINP